LLGSLEFLS